MKLNANGDIEMQLLTSVEQALRENADPAMPGKVSIAQHCDILLRKLNERRAAIADAVERGQTELTMIDQDILLVQEFRGRFGK